MGEMGGGEQRRDGREGLTGAHAGGGQRGREGGREAGRILVKIHSLDSGGGSETQMWGVGAKASHS